MKITRTIAAAVAAVALALGGVALTATSASAHDKSASVTCSTASVSLTNYDQGATALIIVDGVPKLGYNGTTGLVGTTFGGHYVQSWPLTSDANHVSHRLQVTVISTDGAQYNLSFDQTATGCYTPPDVADAAVSVTALTPSCNTATSYTDAQFAIQNATWDGPIDNTPGTHDRTATPTAHHTFSGSNKVTYTVYAAGANGSCAGIACKITGTPYTEGDDHPAVLTESGYSFVSKHDGHATGLLFPVSGNLQGITSISYATSNVVGNGIFYRIIVNLTGDGLGAYNSLSITDGTITQASVANVGSKNIFLGKTIAQIAAAYPHNTYTSMGWATGSSYAAGDGATLTGWSGDCGNANFVPTRPSDTHRTTTVTTDEVCTPGGVGGGSTTTTVTNYTTTATWNASTASYDLVESVDSGYPKVTVNKIAADESCPTHVVAVKPSVPSVNCGLNESVVLPSDTDSIHYTLTSNDTTGYTVTASPTSDAVVIDGDTVFSGKYDAVVKCIIPTPALALTGGNETPWFIGAGVLFGGGILLSIIAAVAYRRRQA